MGSLLGVLRGHATRLGMTVEQYQARVASGQRWCCGCKEWHGGSRFTTDNTRSDGKARMCRKAKSLRSNPKPVPLDRRRAHRVVYMRIRRGQLPHPNTLPCSRCRCTWSPGCKRHEYHHHRGYEKPYQADVVALCSSCHDLEDKHG